MTAPKPEKCREYSGHTAAVYALCPSPREESFFSAGSDGRIAEWEIESGKGITFADTQNSVFSLQWIPERNVLVAGLSDGGIRFFDVTQRKECKASKAHEKGVFDFLYLKEKDIIIASSADGKLSVWNGENLELLALIPISSSSVRCLCPGPNSTFFAGASDGNIYHIDADLRPIQQWKAHSPSVFRICNSPISDTLFSVGRDAHLRSWKGKTFEALASVPAHMYSINDLCTDGKYLFTGSMDKSIRIWNPQNMELVKVIDHARHGCHKFGINRLLSLRNTLLSCGDDRLIMAWNI